PMHTARVSTAPIVNPGFFAKTRKPYLASAQRFPMHPPRQHTRCFGANVSGTQESFVERTRFFSWFARIPGRSSLLGHFPRDRVFAYHPAVLQLNDPVSVLRVSLRVRHLNNRRSRFVQPLE